ncbi:MAG TPA: hypothetical protein VJC07_03335 [Candidatus Nanoarchaeia archaeon]|nr:hypothetical protein [Candidatus Nanoarchaeia archaeon]
MRIGVDLDEVLGSFAESFLAYHNGKYRTFYKPSDFREFQMHRTLQISKQEELKRILDFYKSPNFRDMPPIPGSQEATRVLRRHHELFVITGRHDQAAEETRRWLMEHFPRRFSGLYLTNYNHDNGSGAKAKVCNNLGVDVYVDDGLEYALECARPGRHVLLPDRPWNQAELPHGVRRVFSWEEITRLLSRSH